MSQLSDHFGYDTGNYGRKPALIASISVHVLALVVGAVLAYRQPSVDPQIMTHRIRLGGPKNMDLGGEKRKAPVVGKSTPAKAKNQPKKNTRRTPPKAKKDEVGLKKTPPKKQKNTPPPKNASDERDRAGRTQPAPEPEKKDTEKSARAVGGLGGESGVAVEIGDGSKDINLEDLEFLAFFKMVRARLTERWASRGLSGGACTVRFHVDREGNVSEVSISKSSGLGYLDGPAKRAVMGVELPPLPQSYEGDVLILNILFNYDKK